MMDIVICPNCQEENSSRNMYCSKCGTRLGGAAQQPAGVVPMDRAPAQAYSSANTSALEGKVNQLENQVQQLNNQISQLRNEMYVNRSGSSALQSPNFLSRAFAVWGHYFVAQLIISVGIAIIYVCIIAIIGGSILSNF